MKGFEKDGDDDGDVHEEENYNNNENRNREPLVNNERGNGKLKDEENLPLNNLLLK